MSPWYIVLAAFLYEIFMLYYAIRRYPKVHVKYRRAQLATILLHVCVLLAMIAILQKWINVIDIWIAAALVLGVRTWEKREIDKYNKVRNEVFVYSMETVNEIRERLINELANSTTAEEREAYKVKALAEHYTVLTRGTRVFKECMDFVEVCETDIQTSTEAL